MKKNPAACNQKSIDPRACRPRGRGRRTRLCQVRLRHAASVLGIIESNYSLCLWPRGGGGLRDPPRGRPTHRPRAQQREGRKPILVVLNKTRTGFLPCLCCARGRCVGRPPGGPLTPPPTHTPPRPTPGIPAGGRELSVRTACRMGCDEKKAEVLRHLRLFSRRTPNRQRKRTDKKFSLLPSAPPSIRISSLGLLAANTVPAPVGGDRSAAFAVKQESSPLPGHHRHGPFGAAGGF